MGAISGDPRGAADRGLGDRGTSDTSVFPANPLEEDVSAAEDPAEPLAGCNRLPYFPPAENMSDGDIRYMISMTGMYYVPGMDGTICLIQAARSLQNNLEAVARRKPKAYPVCLKRLLDIRSVIKDRTAGPYQISFDTRPRKPLPKEVLEYWPFSEHVHWTEDLEALKRDRLVMQDPAVLVEKKEHIQADDAKMAEIEATMLELEKRINRLSLTGTGLDNTPQIKEAIAVLSTLTLRHIAKQTGVTADPAFDDDKLIRSIEVFVYHSVYSVVLDKQGEPIDLYGRLHYPILVPDPGSVMERSLPVPGTYISVRKYGFGHFQVDGKKIRKIILGGVGGFIENHGGGVRVPHEFHERIQNWLDSTGHAYVASLVVNSAFNPKELSASAIKEKFPELTEAVFPYAVKEMRLRARTIFKNWDEIAKQIGKEVLEQVIVDRIKDKIKWWLVKKIGVKIVPLVNVASAVHDLFAGEEERRRVRNAIACIILHVKGTSQDDLHIAAKVLAKIIIEALEDAIMDALVSKAVQGGSKLIRRRKGDAGAEPQGNASDTSQGKGQEQGQIGGSGTAVPATSPGADAGSTGQAAVGEKSTGQAGTGGSATSGAAVSNPVTADTGTQNRGTGHASSPGNLGQATLKPGAVQDAGTGAPPEEGPKLSRAKEESDLEGGEFHATAGEEDRDDSKGSKRSGEKPQGRLDHPAAEQRKKRRERSAKEGEGEAEQRVETVAARRDPTKGEDQGASKGEPKGKAREKGDKQAGEEAAPQQVQGRTHDKGEDQGEIDASRRARGTDDNGTGNRGTPPQAPSPSQGSGTGQDQTTLTKAQRKRREKIAWVNHIRQRWGASYSMILNAIAAARAAPWSKLRTLRQAFGNVASGLFAHHLIPVTVLKQHDVAQAAVVGGFDFNGKPNGVLLRRPEHEGGHDEYNQIILQEMDHFAAGNPHYTPEEAKRFVESRVDAWRELYLTAGEF
jgi:hypothetical protein